MISSNTAFWFRIAKLFGIGGGTAARTFIRRVTVVALSSIMILVSLSLSGRADAIALVGLDTKLSVTTPVFLFVYADWCPNCRQQQLVIDELQQEYFGNIEFVRIDSQQYPQIIQQLGVQAFPAMFLFREVNGKQYLYQEFTGFTDKQVLKASFDNIASSGHALKSVSDSSANLIADPSDLGSNVVAICDWQGCTSGAVSISQDDNYSYCLDKLNSHNFKGTFYLMDTKDFSTADWVKWQDIYKEGHELGGHTETHPCYALDDSTLRYELSANKNDIVANVGVAPQEVSSFAWPCGENTPQEEQIASEYYVSARGYFINQLEDKNPADFMNLKSFNSPRYNGHKYDPPNLMTVADMAESQGKWANFVFHNSCDDDGVIDYLPTKDLWVAPVGTVAKYIIERQNSQINNLQYAGSYISFNLVNGQDHVLYNQELTIKVDVGNATVQDLRIDNVSKPFTPYNGNATSYIKFNILPTGNNRIEISTTASPTPTPTPTPMPTPTPTPTPTPNGNGVVILDIEDLQAGWLEDIAATVVQTNIDENVDLLANIIPYHISSASVLAPKLQEWNTSDQGLIEIGQHGYDHSEYLNQLSYAQQKTILQKGVAELNVIGISPKTFTPAFGNQNTDTLSVLNDLGFHIDLDCWEGLSSTANILVLKQCACELSDKWGVSGSEVKFKSSSTLMTDIDSTIGSYGYAIVAFHMQDFSTANGALDSTKLDQYRQILRDLKNSGKYQFMTPEEYYQTVNTPTLAVTTNTATSISSNSATLNGYLNSLGTVYQAMVSFQWGKTTAYGNETNSQSMNTAGSFIANLTGLTPGTTYHFRAKAVGNVTSYGSDMSFTTTAVNQPPTVTTNAATSVSTNSAALNGYLNSLGTVSPVMVSFQWGTNTRYGRETTAQAMTTTGPFIANLNGLTSGTTYHFRAKAVGNGTSYGADLIFRCPKRHK